MSTRKSKREEEKEGEEERREGLGLERQRGKLGRKRILHSRDSCPYQQIYKPLYRNRESYPGPSIVFEFITDLLFNCLLTCRVEESPEWDCDQTWELSCRLV